jgi:hypothetical protein
VSISVRVGIRLKLTTSRNQEAATSGKDHGCIVNLEIYSALDDVEDLGIALTPHSSVEVDKAVLTYVLSLAALLGLRPEGGMTNCPAAINSSSENTLSKYQLPSAANFGLNILAGYATPVTRNKIEIQISKNEGLRRSASSLSV